MPFVSTKRKLRLAKPGKIFETRHKTVSQLVDGVVKNVSVLECVDVTDPDLISQLPTPEEYSLENLLANNIPLNEVNTVNMLSPDLATREQYGSSVASELENVLSEKVANLPPSEN